jgi:hypothetical protein
MKKLSITLTTVSLGLILAATSIVAYEHKSPSNISILAGTKSSTSSTNNETSTSDSAEKNKAIDKAELYSIAMSMEIPPAYEENKEVQVATAEDSKADQAPPVQQQPKLATAQNATTKSSLSRGGTPPSKNTVKSAETTSQQSAGKTELLDWWKGGSSAFPRNSTATVKDLYTGKTFKIKRTMGTNHADCEALTLEDTNIIKSIWGGFSWERRPVHVLINGRVLAASMSAMPHAGIDSAPAYQVVNNRSGDYGRGENLDVIKGNGMDGHFDIHFLNSTRHKDSKVDPQHQAAIKVAAGK